MPELGSKISLISKADIRYEGRLFTVDPQECTIALANVRSYGTEDRDTAYPIMPQPTVYDYILFRGSDIKDIRVVNSVPVPNDPAIMQMHLPPNPQNFMPQNFPPMQQGGGAPPMNNFGAFGQMQQQMQGPPMGGNITQQAQSPIHTQQQGNNSKNLAPGSGSGQKNKKSNSRSGTPQNAARKSPTSEMAVQTNQNQRENQSGKDKPHQNQRNNQRNNNQQQRERRDSGRNEGQENKGGYRNQNQNQRPHHMNNQQQPQRGYNNNNRGQNHQGPNQGHQGQNNQMRNNQGGSARMPRQQGHMNNYRQQNNNQGTPNQNQNKQTNGPQQQQQRGNKPNTLKFENEFDFEQGNSKFEELRAALVRLKVGSDESKPTEQVNGEVEKKDDSGNETGADHEVEVDENGGYDKNKSFFDNISCEAVERSKGKTQRTDWRQERKLNSETFGYTSFNRRGNFRGRGGYYQNQYNRGRPGGFRNNNMNYRPMRNRNQNSGDGRNNAPSNQGSGQQSQNQSAPVAAN